MSRVYNFSAGPAVLPEEVLKEVADEIGEYYFHKDRHSVRRMAEVYDPKIDRFNNEELIKIALENDQQIMLEIQEIMQRER